MRVDPVEDRAEAYDGRVRAGIVQPGQGYQPRGSLDQCGHGGCVARALDQITFPMAGNDAIIDLRWPLMDAGHVRDAAPAIFPTGTRTATLARLSETGNPFGTQRSARHGVARGVDRLVTHLKRRLVQIHASPYACDLFKQMVLPQQARHLASQGAILRQARGTSRHRRQGASALLRQRRDSRSPPAGAPRFLATVAGLLQPFHRNSRLIELGVQPCSRLNWIIVRSSQLRCL